MRVFRRKKELICSLGAGVCMLHGPTRTLASGRRCTTGGTQSIALSRGTGDERPLFFSVEPQGLCSKPDCLLSTKWRRSCPTLHHPIRSPPNRHPPGETAASKRPPPRAGLATQRATPHPESSRLQSPPAPPPPSAAARALPEPNCRC